MTFHTTTAFQAETIERFVLIKERSALLGMTTLTGTIQIISQVIIGPPRKLVATETSQSFLAYRMSRPPQELCLDRLMASQTERRGVIEQQ